MEKYEILPPSPGKHNMENYEETYKNFKWEDAEKLFSWHTTGRVNIAYEAVDRNVDELGLGDKVALYYWDGKRDEKYTFADIKRMSNKFANVLKKYGIGKGDRVFIFMPRRPELYFSFIGICKVGAIVGPLFEAFMEAALKDRLSDAEAVAVVTTPELKGRIRKEELPHLKYVFVVGANGQLEEREIDWDAEMAQASEEFEIEWVDRETPLFLLYTSGSTGKPKGIVHVHNDMIGYKMTGLWVQDLQPDDIYWCTADPGWVSGVAYGIFAPWLNGVTTVVRGGRFKPEDWYATLEKYGVTVWYSAPTAFRMLMAAGDELVKKYDLSKLRHILSVGEPLNPEVIRWGMQVFNVRIHDTWFMTETGMNMICNYPCMPIKPGSMGKPVPGVEAAIVDDHGNVLPPLQIGNLAIKRGWPAQMRAVWKNEEKFKEYFRLEPWYISGDLAYMDEDGYFYFQGRIDDVINTSGERVGPFEVESKLLEHPAVAEAGVIGKPDPLRGEIIKAFITLREGYTWSEELAKELREFVKNGLAAHAAPREFEVMDKLPKTRSGKIMRRVLKAWELGLPVGDLSTLED
ncbi:MAG: acetyl-CoA synthetase [Eubacteriales bacterium]|nr:acetyl-CoA synthetase [Eubacteriales bacterium]MDN5363605.1 acetyl-CoA synthetase [Eubacteriales bacterium]